MDWENSKDMGKIVKISQAYARMLNSAKPGSEMGIMEYNEKFVVDNLLTDPDFKKALYEASKRGVRIKFMFGLSKELSDYLQKTPEEKLFNNFCNVYAYGGVKNLASYMALCSDKQILWEEALDLARGFERDVLGKRRFYIKARGFIGKIFGKYSKISVEDPETLKGRTI